MNSESIQIQQLQKELAYYKSQVDRLSGSTLSNQYAFAQLSNVSKKYINGFHIIADIQRTFSFYSSKESLYEQFLERIFSQMFLDRVILLEIIKGKKELKPILWKGFDGKESSHLNNTSLTMPEEFFLEKKSVFVSSEIVPARFEKRIQSSLLTPYFILTPLVKNQQVWGALFVGMKHEFNPISYIPLSKLNIDMFESLAGVISAMSQQLEQLEVMEKERNRIARDMHDDIGSELSKISITIGHLKNQFKNDVNVTNDLNIIKESAGSIINNIGNIIWALNPTNNTLDALLGYLRGYAYEYLDMHRIDLLFNLPEKTEKLVISHETKTHIFMVVKEALHNIVKHAGATEVAINVFIASNKIKCTIVDNGKGISSKKNSPFGNGLRNMQQRISETGGTLIIHSEPDKGTSLDFEVPI